MKILIIFFAIFMSIPAGFAQGKIDFSGDIELSGYAFQGELPFWLHTNSGGFKASETNIATSVNTLVEYGISTNHSLQLGLGFFYRDGVSDDFQRNNLFIKYKNNLLDITLGSEEVVDKFQGLGVVRDNFSLSGNTRALPGLNISLIKPVKAFSNFYVDGSIAHYNLNDDRFVNGTRVHNKKLEITWKYKSNSSLLFGIEHFSQWGGISPDRGPQPDGFSDFIDVFFARNASSDNASIGDQLNSLGNSLGYYKLEYLYSDASSEYLLYHHHPFEDGSGTALKNFPDGIWGFYYSLKEDEYTSVLKGFLLEYVSTVDQSGRFGRSGRDNYFRSGTYRSGWTYEGNVIGLPFISVPDNTRVEAFHMGINLEFGKLQSRFKTSYVRSLGTFINPFDPIRKQLFLATQHSYTISNSSSIRLDIGYDVNNTTQDNFGTGVSYIYKLK